MQSPTTRQNRGAPRSLHFGKGAIGISLSANLSDSKCNDFAVLPKKCFLFADLAGLITSLGLIEIFYT